MAQLDGKTLELVASKIAIGETLARYCRGIDRCDVETLKSVFWPEAIANYGEADQKAMAWCDAVIGALKTMLRTQHAISNILIEVDGDRAAAETYCRAYHEVETPQGRREMMVGGRYLDSLERRNGEWRILRRQYVMDFNQNGPSSSEWSEGLYAGLKVIGLRYPDDPLYRAKGC